MDITTRTHTMIVISAIATLTLTLGPAPVFAAPSSLHEVSPLEQLDEATREAIDLEQSITDLQAERVSIDSRLEVLDARVADQLIRLEEARAELRRTRTAYSSRVISIYKIGPISPLIMLFESRSFGDFVTRTSLFTRIANRDKDLWTSAAKAASEEHYQATTLEDLHAQESELHDINESRQRTLQRNLVRQQELVEQLSEEAAAYLAEIRARNAQTRQDWIEGSIPLDTEFRFVPATVAPYDDCTYLVPDYQPVRYESTGEDFLAVCSWYGPGFDGKTTAAGQIFNEDDFTCASRTLAFGTRLALTRGDRRIIVVVNDRGPFIPGRDLDLSRAAAAALGFSGVEPVHAEFVVVSGE